VKRLIFERYVKTEFDTGGSPVVGYGEHLRVHSGNVHLFAHFQHVRLVAKQPIEEEIEIATGR